MKRHCSVCRSTAHDRRFHERVNPDFFTANGVVHPMRKDKHEGRSHRSPQERELYSPSKAKGESQNARDKQFRRELQGELIGSAIKAKNEKERAAGRVSIYGRRISDRYQDHDVLVFDGKTYHKYRNGKGDGTLTKTQRSKLISGVKGTDHKVIEVSF